MRSFKKLFYTTNSFCFGEVTAAAASVVADAVAAAEAAATLAPFKEDSFADDFASVLDLFSASL